MDKDDNPPEDGEGRNRNSVCPSKSTVYLGNINYSLTNNDLVTLLEKFGKVVCTKIAKDNVTRRSKGYAFVQFLKEKDAIKCVEEYNGVKMFGRKWTCSIAKDNGRSAEFITKRSYPDKTRCYECGEFGHLSYKCSKNVLGTRKPPPKKKRKRFKPNELQVAASGSQNSETDSSTDTDSEKDLTNRCARTEPELDTLSLAIRHQQDKEDEQDYREIVAAGNYDKVHSNRDIPVKRKFVKDLYFSDEETLENETDSR